MTIFRILFRKKLNNKAFYYQNIQKLIYLCLKKTELSQNG